MRLRDWPRPVGQDAGGKVPAWVSAYPLWAPVLAFLSLLGPVIGGALQEVGAVTMLVVTGLGAAAMVFRGWFVAYGPIALLAPGLSAAFVLAGRDHLPAWVVVGQLLVFSVAALSVVIGIVVGVRRRS